MLKFALVGCGRIARKHAELIGAGAIKGARLSAVCDTKEDRAKFYGTKYAVPWYSDMHQMANENGGNIDIFSILTESGLHAKHTIELAPYGKHLIVEKPMALTLDDADKMIQACDLAGVKLFVVKQNRLNYPVRKLREALDKGRFGKLVMGTVRVRWCRDQAYYDQDAWRGTWASDGGVFTNQASHHIDLLEWMLGEPESVFAKSMTALVDIETEDTGVAIIRFKNGALGLIEATTATRPTDTEGSLSLLGATGMVEIAGFSVNEMKTWNFSKSEPDDDRVIRKYRENPPDVYGFGHIEYLNQVVDSITNNTPVPVDGFEGRRSLELILAVYESIETGKEVFLPFTPQQFKLGRTA